MDLKQTYNRIAEDWSKDHRDDDWWVEGTDTFASLFKFGATILDVGCGAGVKSRYLSGKGLRVTGIDFSDKLIEIAEHEAPDVGFHVMDMEEVEALHMRFDGVFAQASLLHIPKKKIAEMIKKLVSIINAGGLLYVAVKSVGLAPDHWPENAIMRAWEK